MTTFGVTSLGVDKPSRNLDRLNMTMDTNFFSVELFFCVCLCSSLGHYFFVTFFLTKQYFLYDQITYGILF